MGKQREYIISFSGLSLGKHDYKIEVKDRFFEEIACSEIQKGNIELDLTLNKQSTMLILDFNFKGTVNVMCDRCMDHFDIPIAGVNQLIVKLGSEENYDDTDDIISISSAEHEINIAQFIYEYISLAVPFRRIHPENDEGQTGCNREVIEKLEKVLIKKQEKEKVKSVDPRWEALAKLKAKK